MKLPVLTNKIENRILTVITIVFTVLSMYFVYQFGILPAQRLTNEMLQKQIEIQNVLIRELAKDPKYSIQNDFGKIKPKEGSTVTIDLNNDMKIQLDTTKILPPKAKESFWKRLFNN
jgi:hypothetical protein